MNNIVLSRDEVKALCRTRLRAGQAQFLRQNGIRSHTTADELADSLLGELPAQEA